MSERLDRIENGIDQLNQAINALVSQLISPAVLQSRANFERLEGIDQRLDRMAALGVQTDERLARVAAAQEITIAQIAANAEGVTGGKAESKAADDRFNILLSELREDRKQAARDRKAFQQIVKALLVRVASVNTDIDALGDRINDLETSEDS